MALSLGVAANSKVQIGQAVLTVIDIVGATSMTVRMNNGPTLTLTADEKIAIAPNVVAYCGISAQHKQQPRIAFEAPREIRIERLG